MRDPVCDSRLGICALVSYDGTDFFGFQVQESVPTIQGELERALSRVATVKSRVVGSGRTDTGVHASGQVVAVHLQWTHSLAALQNAWNANLPASISVGAVQTLPEGFHPRFSAVTRTYRYYVDVLSPQPGQVAPKHLPLTERFALFQPAPLNLDAMQQAASWLIGEHDFAAFGQPPQGNNSVREVFQATWQIVQQDLLVFGGYSVQRIAFTITATAFLRQMVRNIVGTLLEVGRERCRPDDVQQVLLSRDRSRCAPPAPPNGLVLDHVEYPPDSGVKF